MEGDLLEVALDEVQQLWQLLQQDAHSLSAFQKKGIIDTEVRKHINSVHYMNSIAGNFRYGEPQNEINP